MPSGWPISFSPPRGRLSLRNTDSAQETASENQRTQRIEGQGHAGQEGRDDRQREDQGRRRGHHLDHHAGGGEGAEAQARRERLRDHQGLRRDDREVTLKIFGFAGWSGSGKTTLIEKLIPRLVKRGLRVSL